MRSSTERDASRSRPKNDPPRDLAGLDQSVGFCGLFEREFALDPGVELSLRQRLDEARERLAWSGLAREALDPARLPTIAQTLNETVGSPTAPGVTTRPLATQGGDASLEGARAERLPDDVGLELGHARVVVRERLRAELADAGVPRLAGGCEDRAPSRRPMSIAACPVALEPPCTSSVPPAASSPRPTRPTTPRGTEWAAPRRGSFDRARERVNIRLGRDGQLGVRALGAVATTRSPVSTRVPAASPGLPSTRGKDEAPALRWLTSKRLTPAASTRTRTSPSPGAGSGTSSIRITSGGRSRE